VTAAHHGEGWPQAGEQRGDPSGGRDGRNDSPAHGEGGRRGSSELLGGEALNSRCAPVGEQHPAGDAGGDEQMALDHRLRTEVPPARPQAHS
jgi:hypothetical protein